jgi:hypothetical protein
MSAYSVTGGGGCSDQALYGWSSRSMALAACGGRSPRRPDSCASRSARRMMSSSARSTRRRRLTAHRPRRRRRMAGQCGHPVRGVPRRREARRGPGAARWTAGSAAAGGRMGVGVATRLPRQGRNRPRGELMTRCECEAAISYPRHGEIHDHHPAAEHCSRLRGRGHRRRPCWLRRSTDRRLPASRLQDSQILRPYLITPGPFGGNSSQL